MIATAITIPTLETERFVMRAPVMDDLPAFTAFCASDGMRFMGGAIPADKAFSFLSSVIGHWQLRGFGRWIVADKASGQALGLVGLAHMQDWPEPEIAWAVFGEGRGVATEAARATMDYAYDVLGWDDIACVVHPDNGRSITLAARLGFVRNGTFHDGHEGDLLAFRHRRAMRAVA